MKLITAIIQPDRVEAVREALFEADIKRITVSRCDGHGRQLAEKQIYRGEVVVPSLISKVRIDIACNDEFVETTCNAIISGAKHGGGEVGDGKILITPLDECIRIRTGERGKEAI